MSKIKNAGFRYDSEMDSDIAKWLDGQPNKNESFQLAIITIIDNYGNDDLRKALPSGIKLEESKNTERKTINKEEVAKRTRKKETNKKSNHLKLISGLQRGGRKEPLFYCSVEQYSICTHIAYKTSELS